MTIQRGLLRETLVAHWDAIQVQIKSVSPTRGINGCDLDVATVLAVARYFFAPSLDNLGFILSTGTHLMSLWLRVYKPQSKRAKKRFKSLLTMRRSYMVHCQDPPIQRVSILTTIVNRHKHRLRRLGRYAYESWRQPQGRFVARLTVWNTPRNAA